MRNKHETNMTPEKQSNKFTETFFGKVALFGAGAALVFGLSPQVREAAVHFGESTVATAKEALDAPNVYEFNDRKPIKVVINEGEVLWPTAREIAIVTDQDTRDVLAAIGERNGVDPNNIKPGKYEIPDVREEIEQYYQEQEEHLTQNG